MNTKTTTALAFAVLAIPILLGTAMDAPSAADELRDTAAVVTEAERNARIDHAIDRAALAVCRETHSASAAYRWSDSGELICYRSALVAQAEDRRALRIAAKD
jgi:hypothetical protein